MKPAGSTAKARRGYRKSGIHSAEKALSRRGLSALDGPSAIARAVRDWRTAVAGDLGGPEVLSQAQRTLLNVAAQDVVLLSVADSWLRENAHGIINRCRRAFVPLVEQRLRVASHLAELLKTLGLKRTPVRRAYRFWSRVEKILSGAVGAQGQANSASELRPRALPTRGWPRAAQRGA